MPRSMLRAGWVYRAVRGRLVVERDAQGEAVAAGGDGEGVGADEWQKCVDYVRGSNIYVRRL